MFKAKQNSTVPIFAALVALSLLAGCATTGPANLDLGAPAAGHYSDRTIRVGVNTKYVNVDDGEVVKFVVQEPGGTDKSFTWRFDVARETVGDLSKLAPAGVLGRSVKVYVGPNPRYSVGS